MSNTIVLYTSKYGATKKYAEWLSQALSCDSMETRHADAAKLLQYDRIVLGGGIYAGGIAGFSFLKKNYGKLQDKKIIVFAVGASPYDEKAMQVLRARHFQGALAEIPCCYCRGAWNEDALSLPDRMLCAMLKKAVAKKDPADCEPWEAALMQTMGSNVDWTDKESLTPVIEALQG